jgi:hypothetical protein
MQWTYIGCEEPILGCKGKNHLWNEGRVRSMTEPKPDGETISVKLENQLIFLWLSRTREGY